VHVDKDEIVDLLRSRGEHDKAATVDCALPRRVDTEADAGLLHQFEVSVRDVAEVAGGTGGAGVGRQRPVDGTGAGVGA
jgi:hypothetical protein